VQLPVWNALYQVRDFAQYITWVRAKAKSGALEVKANRQINLGIDGTEEGASVEYEIVAALPGPYGAQAHCEPRIFHFAKLMYLPDARDA